MQERLQATIPENSKWHTEDIEAKAAALGMEKGEFILNAVDLSFNFDEVFYKKVQRSADLCRVPVWVYIQNKLIKIMAREAAEVEAGTWTTKLLDEFIFNSEGVITGEALFEALKANYIIAEKRKAIGGK